jgi:catechol-2,3-dioxygenase
MRFVTPKTESQQTLTVLHRVREMLVQDRTSTINQMRGILLEFVDHVAITVTDLAKSCAFYDDLFGTEVVPSMSSKIRCSYASLQSAVRF